MEKYRNKKRDLLFLVCYTAFFILCCFLAFRYFGESGKRMIWSQDGLTQHYVALSYYARWARSVLRSILAGHPSLPTYNLHIGFGADLFTTLQYYVLGDPFSLPAVFVPQKYMLDFHDAMIILRLYIAGICFDRFLCGTGHREIFANIAGAIVYIFSSFTLYGIHHPYFLNSLVWFPLLLLGVEQMCRGRRGRLFTVAVFLACISNFYFFYMLALFTAVYGIWKALKIHVFPAFSAISGRGDSFGDGPFRPSGAGRSWKRGNVRRRDAYGRYVLGRACRKAMILLGSMLGRALLGTAMGMCFFLPVVLRFLSDPRTGSRIITPTLYDLEYYRELPVTFLSFGTRSGVINWTCLGYGAIGLLGVFALFLSHGREKTGARLGWLCMLLMILFPAAGKVMNGFTYPANRWVWAFALMSGFCAAVMAPQIITFGRKQTAALIVCLAVYAFFYENACRQASRSVTAEQGGMPEIAIAFGLVVVFRVTEMLQQKYPSGNLRRLQRNFCGILLTAAAVFSLSTRAQICYQRGIRSSDVGSFSSDTYIAGMVGSDAAGMKELLGVSENENFYRYSARSLTNNFSVLHDVSNTQYFWSLSDSRIRQFFDETGQTNAMVHLYDGLDNRTMLDAIAGVKYYKRGDGTLLPFGYEKLEGLKYDNRKYLPEDADEEERKNFPDIRFAVYENRYAIPFGFTSDHVISKTEWLKLTIPERQQALMQAVVLEDESLKVLSDGKTFKPASEKDPPAEENSVLKFTDEEETPVITPENGIEILCRDEDSVSILVLDRSAELTLLPEKMESTVNREVSIRIDGMQYEPLTEEQIVTANLVREENGNDPYGELKYLSSEAVKITVDAQREGESVSRKDIAYSLSDNPWGTGRTDFLSCCGYTEKGIDKIRLKFSRPGTYTFRKLNIVYMPMEDYTAQALALREYSLQDLDTHELTGSGATCRITGTVNIPQTGEGETSCRILCLQIPLSSGLTAYVDGEKTPLLQADTMFCGIFLEAGEHRIELQYSTPGLKAGLLISLLAWAVFIAEAVLRPGKKTAP